MLIIVNFNTNLISKFVDVIFLQMVNKLYDEFYIV